MTHSAMELVALAKEASVAPAPLRQFHGERYEVYDDGRTRITEKVGSWPNLVFEVILSAETTSSAEALARALLASAIHYHSDCYREGEDTVYEEYAILADRQADASTRDEARDLLLDALLAPVRPNA